MHQFQDDWTRTREDVRKIKTDAGRASDLAVSINRKFQLLMEEVAEWTTLTDQVKRDATELNQRMDRMQQVENDRNISRFVREMITPPGFLSGQLVLPEDTIRPVVQEERQQINLEDEVLAPHSRGITNVATVVEPAAVVSVPETQHNVSSPLFDESSDGTPNLDVPDVLERSIGEDNFYSQYWNRRREQPDSCRSIDLDDFSSGDWS
jgi:hypothetical protein